MSTSANNDLSSVQVRLATVTAGGLAALAGILVAADTDDGSEVALAVLVVASLVPYAVYYRWVRLRWLAVAAGLVMVSTTVAFTVFGLVDDSSTAALAFLVPINVNALVVVVALITQRLVRRRHGRAPTLT